MENNYYDECITNIKKLMNDGELDEAKKLLEEELSMPYIPSFAESRFLELKRELHAMNSKEINSMMSASQIEDALLSQDSAVQLRAIKALQDYSCRSFIEVIQRFFDTVPDAKLQALMIDILIEQQIRDEFEITYEGMQMSFIPLYQERPHETDGFVSAQKILHCWFENDNPALLQMCEQLLIQECFLMLPLSYEEEEGLSLAVSIAEYVSNSLDEGASFEKIASQLDKNVKRCALKSCFV